MARNINTPTEFGDAFRGSESVETHTIDITPTLGGYRQMLRMFEDGIPKQSNRVDRQHLFIGASEIRAYLTETDAEWLAAYDADPIHVGPFAEGFQTEISS
jgi:hypothetical protein